MLGHTSSHLHRRKIQMPGAQCPPPSVPTAHCNAYTSTCACIKWRRPQINCNIKLCICGSRVISLQLAPENNPAIGKSAAGHISMISILLPPSPLLPSSGEGVNSARSAACRCTFSPQSSQIQTHFLLKALKFTNTFFPQSSQTENCHHTNKIFFLPPNLKQYLCFKHNKILIQTQSIYWIDC